MIPDDFIDDTPKYLRDKSGFEIVQSRQFSEPCFLLGLSLCVHRVKAMQCFELSNLGREAEPARQQLDDRCVNAVDLGPERLEFRMEHVASRTGRCGPDA